MDPTPTWRGWSAGALAVPAAVVLLLVVTASLLGLRGRIVGPTEDMRTGPRGMSAPASERAFFADFRDTAWLPVRDLAAGGNPYDAPRYLERHPYAFEFTYAPAQLTVFGPLAALPLGAAALVWFGCLVVGAAALAVVTVTATRLPRRADVVIALSAAILVLRPMTFMLLFGQTSILAILGSSVALVRRRPDALTSAGVALAWLKPQFGIPVAVILLALGARRPVLWGTGVAALVSLPAVVWASANVGGVGPFLESLPRALHAALSSSTTRPSNGSVPPDLGGLLGTLTRAESSAVLVLLVLLVVLGAGVLAVVRSARRGHEGVLVPTACALTTVLLCLPHFSYDLLLLVPALGVSVLAARDAAPGPAKAMLGAACCAMALALFPVPQVGAREVQLALLIVGLGSVLALTELSGPLARRAGLVAVAVGSLLAVRYLAGPVLAPALSSGALGAWMLLVAWLLLLAVALDVPRERSTVESVA